MSKCCLALFSINLNPRDLADSVFYMSVCVCVSVCLSASAASHASRAAEQAVGRINLKLSGILGKCLESCSEFSPRAWGAPFARDT